MSYNQKSNSTDTSFWDKRQNKIVSSIGGWQGGKDVVSHGYSLIMGGPRISSSYSNWQGSK